MAFCLLFCSKFVGREGVIISAQFLEIIIIAGDILLGMAAIPDVSLPKESITIV